MKMLSQYAYLRKVLRSNNLTYNSSKILWASRSHSLRAVELRSYLKKSGQGRDQVAVAKMSHSIFLKEWKASKFNA